MPSESWQREWDHFPARSFKCKSFRCVSRNSCERQTEINRMSLVYAITFSLGYMSLVAADVGNFTLPNCTLYHELVPAHVPVYLDARTYATCSGCFRVSAFADKPAERIACPAGPVDIAPDTRRRLGLFVATPHEVWPNNRVCYRIEPYTFTSSQLSIISSAQRLYEKLGISFVTQKECVNGVRTGKFRRDTCRGCRQVAIIKKDGSDKCYSNVGMTKHGTQAVVLNDICFKGSSRKNSKASGLGTVMHELGHTLGLDHEHQHPNTETVVLWKNVPDDVASNYMKEYGVRYTAYDRKSIMHYGEYPIGAEGHAKYRRLCFPLPRCDGTKRKRCIKKFVRFCEQKHHTNCYVATDHVCSAPNLNLGQRVSLSRGDIAALSKMYSLKSRRGYKKIKATSGPFIQVKDRPTSAASEFTCSLRLTWVAVVLMWLVETMYVD